MRVVFKLKNGTNVTFSSEHSKILVESGEFQKFIDEKLEHPNKDLLFTDNQTGKEVKTNYSELIAMEVNFE